MIKASQLPAWCGPSGNARWPYVVKKDSILNTGIECDWDVMITSVAGHRLGYFFDDGRLLVLAGYMFDGATSAPDFPEAMRAVLGHDILCQATLHREFPIDRKEADDLFLRWALEDGFRYARAYHAAIRMFGGLYARLHPVPDDERVSLVFYDAD